MPWIERNSRTGRFAIRYRVPDSRSKRTMRGTFDTEAAAIRSPKWAEATAIEDGRSLDQPTADRATVGHYMDHYLRTIGHLQPTSQQTVTSHIRVHLRPEFGGRRLSSLAPSEIAVWKSKMLKSYAPSTTAQILGTFRTILKVALEDGSAGARRLLESTSIKNPKDSRPKKEPEEKLFTDAEIMQLWNVQGVTQQERMMARCAIALGIRKGEVGAITIDKFEREHLGGREQLFYRVDRQIATHGKLKQAKHGSVRRVPVPETLWTDLNTLIDGQGLGPEGLIFYSNQGRAYGATSLDTMFERIAAAAGVELNGRKWHGCRHALATGLISKGLPIRAVQEQLGHSDETITAKHYSHAVDAYKEMLASAVDEHTANLTDAGPMQGQPTSDNNTG